MPEPSDDRRAETTARYAQLEADVAAILYRHDPVGIAFDDNPGEYSPETSSILARIRDAGTVDDVRRIVHEEFVHWFDTDTAGPAAGYQAIAEELWALLRPA